MFGWYACPFADGISRASNGGGASGGCMVVRVVSRKGSQLSRRLSSATSSSTVSVPVLIAADSSSSMTLPMERQQSALCVRLPQQTLPMTNTLGGAISSQSCSSALVVGESSCNTARPRPPPPNPNLQRRIDEYYAACNNLSTNFLTTRRF